MGLYDQVLIKDNHLAGAGLSTDEAVWLARTHVPQGMLVEVEVESMAGAVEAAHAGADIIMLDNMPPAKMRRAVEAVREISESVTLEASGGVTFETVREIAETGVNWISCGALTHSVHSLDIGLDIE